MPIKDDHIGMGFAARCCRFGTGGGPSNIDLPAARMQFAA